MSKQCTKPKRKRDYSWFQDKVLLVQAQANGEILYEEELAFLADPRTAKGQATQTVITYNVAYQADDLDAYNSDCDELNTAQVALMANLSHHSSNALTESNVVNYSETEITSDINIIPYSQYVTESQQIALQNSNSSAQQDALILSVIEQLKTQVINCTKINLDNKSVNDTLTAELERYKEQVKVLKEGQNVDLKSKDNVSDSCEQSVEIDRLKQTLSEHVKEKESLMQTVTLLKNDFKKEESRNIDREIALEKKIKQLDNIVYKRDQSAQTVYMLTKPQFFYDHTTKQALGFQNPFYLKKAQQLEPKLYDDPSPSGRPTKVEVLKELPKVSMINTSLKKLKHHLAGFDVVVKERTTTTTITEGSWGFEHTKACFRSSKLFYVKFGNDHVAKILGYGDYQIGNVTISKVYYVEGLGHNLFSVGQFCDLNLEVAFRQHTCFIRNLEGVDLLTGSRGNNLYTLSLGDMMASSPICLLSKASKTKSWLWHRCLSHLNFGAINHLARHGLVRGLPKLKFEKDHLCFACAMGKRKKNPHKPKSKDTNQEKLYLLHMDLCGPTRVASVNGKKTDNGTEFVNQTLREYYEKVDISHETSVARSPQQNGVVERRNHTLIEASRIMLIYSKALLFLWAEAVATACYTQNCFIIRLRYGKTPYELLHDKLPDLSFFYVFGALYFDELTAMASEHSSPRPALHEMTPATISSGLVQNPPPSTPFVPPSRTYWDILFQPLFDELLNPPSSVDRAALEVIAPIAEVVAPEPDASTGSPSSTTVDHDTPYPKLNLLSFLMMLKRIIMT
ncbi:retrovirus-related pol polyprotein from transposon TNT 1-94 [Tanacetum coccineum]|uniref:Retrovirus-related pol polyprotein from transposon TNT 1-94 n=1 Tax=Tanacetum coccineum TaxID=301880 RepID=A0ABQ5CPW4_9ASTR